MSGGHLAFSYISNADRFNLTKYRDTMYLQRFVEEKISAYKFVYIKFLKFHI